MLYLRFVGKRLLVFFPLIFAASLVIFFLLRTSGVDPINVMLGENRVTEEVAAVLRAQHHLDEPLIVQYGYWIGGALHGDFGTDYVNRQSVSMLIAQRLPVTLGLVLLSALIGTAMAIGLGVLSAVKEGRVVDRAISVIVLVLVSVPSFLLAIVALVLIALFAPGLSFTGAINNISEYFSRILLPAFVLSMYMVALVTRVTRGSMIIQLKSPYAMTMIAKGLPVKAVIWKHCFVNALVPVLTVSTIFVGSAISGAVLVESVFSLAGLGMLLTQAIKMSNYPVIQGCLLVLLVVFLTIGLVTDLIYAAIDPRVRKSGKGVTA